MKPVYITSSAANLDHSLIQRYSLSECLLIDGASLGAYNIIKDRVNVKRVLFVIGKGNNGSDGLELARLLEEDSVDISLYYLFDSGNDENMRRRALLSAPVVSDVYGFDVIIDCIFGFGFKGTLSKEMETVIDRINEASSYVISLDVPSAGRVDADETVVFMVDKFELYNPVNRYKSGIMHLVNPGFPEDELKKSQDGIYLLEDCDLSLKPFGLSEYKNTRGHVAVVGGSLRYPGAPILSAKSAFKSGAGLLTLISSEYVLDKTFSCYPSIILSKEENASFENISSIVIGPGWDSGDKDLFSKAVSSRKPIVVDADGIKFLPEFSLGHTGVITPHIGEFKRLCALMDIDVDISDNNSLFETIKLVANRLECIVVLKSSVVWITDGDQLFIYDGVNPSLGVAGSGDVLSGIIGALLASGEEPLSAAINGVIIHQKAGIAAHKRYGYYMSEELIGEIQRP